MILELEETKNYLRIDDDYTNDDMQIRLLIDVAETYCRDSIDNFDIKLTDKGFESKAKLVMLVLVTNWYENRDFVELKTSTKTRYTVESLVRQMQYGYGDKI